MKKYKNLKKTGPTLKKRPKDRTYCPKKRKLTTNTPLTFWVFCSSFNLVNKFIFFNMRNRKNCIGADKFGRKNKE